LMFYLENTGLQVIAENGEEKHSLASYLGTSWEPRGKPQAREVLQADVTPKQRQLVLLNSMQ
jgi:hypothetical protein